MANQAYEDNEEHEDNTSYDDEYSPIEDISESTLDLKDPMRRVKIYHLSDLGEWIDKGTGHIRCETQDNETNLVLVSESSDERLLSTPISTDEIYALQNATLIVWNDPIQKIEMALSFQHSDGCIMIWNEIRKVQGKPPDGKEIVARNNQEEEGVDDEIVGMGLNGSSLSIGSTGSSLGRIELPEPSIGNLTAILSMITDYRFRLPSYIKADYIYKLFQVFDECEDLESIENCRIIFKIFSGIIAIDDLEILEILFSKNNIMKLIGVLEYDPDLPTKKANHRNFLKNLVIFKEVIPFNNHSILDKIHQTFKIQYIKETILASIIDDQTFSTLSTIIFKNNTMIINAIKEDQEFLKKVFATLLADDIPKEKQKDLSKFLSEFFALLKHQNVNNKIDTYKRLIIDHQLLDAAEKHLENENVSVRHIYSEILLSIAQTIHLSFLGEIKQRHLRNDFNLLRVIIKRIVSEPELGIQQNLTEVIKLLLDPETLLTNSDMFIEQFYKHHIELLASPILNPQATINHFTKPSIKVSCINHALDLLSFTVIHHKYRSKNFLLSNDIISKAVHLLDVYREKDLILGVIRFFKSIISRGDLLLCTNILTNNLFDPIMEVWRRNSSTYNLINSAIIDLFETLRTTTTGRLKQHCVERFRQDFEAVNYVETFAQLIEESDQQEKSENNNNNVSQQESDDAYFNENEEMQKSMIAQDSPERASVEEEDDFFFSLSKHKSSNQDDDDDESDIYYHNEKNHDVENSTPHSPHKLQISLKTNTTSPTKGEVEPNPKKVKF